MSQVIVSGKVIAEGDTLPSAHVVRTFEDGKPKYVNAGILGEVTNMDGRYSIKVSPEDYLTASFVGYGKKTVKVSEFCKQNSCNFDFKLGEDGNMLKEVLVVADKDGKTNWKKIALISGISIVGLVALYFGVKKLRK